MNEENGFIVLQRKIIKWEWWDNPNVAHLFLHLLLSANYEEKQWHGQIIKRGQLITGLKKLSENTGLSVRIIRTCLKRLKSTGEITNQSTNRFRIITIIKYNDYQDKKEKPTSKMTSKLTSKRQATDKQLTTTNNINNITIKQYTPTIVGEAKPSEVLKSPKVNLSNPDINWLIGEFETVMGFKSAGGGKDRFMAKHLLNNFSREQLTAMLTYCATQDYAPRIGSVEKLWFKRGDIIAGIKSLRTTNSKVISI